jgi:hypothetical protein
MDDETDFGQAEYSPEEAGSEVAVLPEYEGPRTPESDEKEEVLASDTALTTFEIPQVDPWKEALAERVGGEPKDWQLGHEGRGYSFDGEHVRDPAGAIWIDANATKEGAELDPEMFQQWREGGDAFYRLPDYPEHMEDRDRIWETMMHFDKQTNEVSYRIYYHDVMRPEKEELEKTTGETTGARAEAQVEWLEDAFVLSPAANDTVAEVFVAAEAAQQMTVAYPERAEFLFDEPAANAVEMSAPQQHSVSEMPAMSATANDNEVQAAWLQELLKDRFEVPTGATTNAPETRVESTVQPTIASARAEPHIEHPGVPAPAKNEIDRSSFVDATPVPAPPTIGRGELQGREIAPATKAGETERIGESERDALLAELLKGPLEVVADAQAENVQGRREEAPAQPAVSSVQTSAELRTEEPKAFDVFTKTEVDIPAVAEISNESGNVAVEPANPNEQIASVIMQENAESHQAPVIALTPDTRLIVADIRTSTEPIAAANENVRSAREYEPSIESPAKLAEAEKEVSPSAQSAETVLRALGLQLSGAHAMPNQSDEPAQSGRNVFPFAPSGARAEVRSNMRENKQFSKDGVIMTRAA